MEICIGNFLVSVNLGFYIRSVQIIAPSLGRRHVSSPPAQFWTRCNLMNKVSSRLWIGSCLQLWRLSSAQDQEADESCLPVTGREMGLWETVFLSIITSHFGIGDRRKSKNRGLHGPIPLWNIIDLTFCQFLLSLISPWPGHPTCCCSVNTNYSRVAEAMFAERSGRGGNMSSGHCLYTRVLRFWYWYTIFREGTF